MPHARRSPALVLGLVGALAVGALGATALQRDSANAQPGCTDSSLVGDFGLKFDGHSKALGRFASVSIWNFDGQGNFRASEEFNSQKTGPKSRSLVGRYEVAGDCSFELLFPSKLVERHEAFGKCVLVAGGDELFCLDAEKGWVTTATGVKM